MYFCFWNIFSRALRCTSENTARLSIPLLGFPLLASGQEKVPGMGTTDEEAVVRRGGDVNSTNKHRSFIKSVPKRSNRLKIDVNIGPLEGYFFSQLAYFFKTFFFTLVYKLCNLLWLNMLPPFGRGIRLLFEWNGTRWLISTLVGPQPHWYGKEAAYPLRNPARTDRGVNKPWTVIV